MGTATIDIKKVNNKLYSIVVIDAEGLHEHVVQSYPAVREKVDDLKRGLRRRGYGVEIFNS